MMRKGPIERVLGRCHAADGSQRRLLGQHRADRARRRHHLPREGVRVLRVAGWRAASPDLRLAERPSKEAVRRYVESVLCVLFELDAGWYEWDPLGTHADGVRWVFGVDGLERTGAGPARRRPLAAPVERPPGRVRGRARRHRARQRRHVAASRWPWPRRRRRTSSGANWGWDAERLASTLEGLERLGLITDPSRPPRRDLPTRRPSGSRHRSPRARTQALGRGAPRRRRLAHPR